MAKERNDIVPPPAFSGPAQLLLYTRYGDPRVAGWDNKWITTWKVKEKHPWFQAHEIKIHKHFCPLLDAAFTALKRSGLHTEIKTHGAGFEIRHLKAGNSVLSVHSWGAAIDLNEEDNPVGGTGAWSKEFINIMEANHIYCGINWNGHKNPMHFAMVNG